MEFWLKTCLILCCYGFFKDFRPSEPFLTDYLLGPVHNLTESQVYYEIYPVWTYSYLAVLVVVFLFTDFLRYKIVVVLEAIAYIVTWILLLWARGVRWMQFMEFCYGIVSATEVAYFTYIYAQVSPDRYQQVSSYTRTALLCGRVAAGAIGQALFSTGVMDPHTLNYLTLSSMCIALVFAVLLPPVKHSIYFHRENKKTNTDAVEGEKKRDDTDTNIAKVEGNETNNIQDDNSSIELSVNLEETGDDDGCSSQKLKEISKVLLTDFKQAYSNAHLLRWSIWWAAATCGCYQVLNYIQPLYYSVENQTDSIFNGGVEATCTLLGAGAAFSVSYMNLNWTRYGELVLAVVSLLDALLLMFMGFSNNIIVVYINYIVFRVSYEFLITIASYQVAKELKSDSYGLVFGVNMFMSLVLQTIMTLVVVDILMIEPGLQFIIYGGYFGFLSFFFFVLFSYKLGTMVA